MRYARVISELNLEIEKLDQAIEELETLAVKYVEGSVKGRAGRTSMGFAERRQVSDRMKEYWRNKRAGGL